jgi:hypothetical protein
LLRQQQNITIILRLLNTKTPAQQITADLPLAAFVPSLLKRWRVDAHTLQRLITKVDAIDLTARTISTKPIAQTD